MPLFRQRPFLLYWFARVFTAAGFQMQGVAMAWQVYQLTGSALDLGLVGLFQFLPRIALTPFAGHAADRHNRRRIAVIAQTVQGLVLLVLCAASFEHLATRELIFLLVFVSGAARTYEGPATQAMLPAVVPLPMFARAVAVNASAIQAATLVAPAVAGGLYILGATAAYGVTAALYVAAALSMQAVPFKAQPVGASSGFLASFIEGLRFMRGRPIILGAISLDMFAVLLGGATAVLPIIADTLLHAGSVGLGLLRSAPAIGALAMSVWLAHHPIRRAVGQRMFAAVAVFGLATIALAFSRSLALSLVILFALGAADMVSVVIRQAMVQLHTPDAMRGRVSAVNSIFIGASNQLGEFESGLTAAWFGLEPSIIIGGVGTLLVTALWMRLFPSLARAQTLEAPPADPAPAKAPAQVP